MPLVQDLLQPSPTFSDFLRTSPTFSHFLRTLYYLFEKVRESEIKFEKAGAGSRRSEEVEEGSRRSEEVGGGRRRSEKGSVFHRNMFYYLYHNSILVPPTELSLRQSRGPSVVASLSLVLTRIRGFYVIVMRFLSSQEVGRK